ncbi:MAG: restriction endonuclease subunit S [Candidatus Omnitrophica bacterium]|nr:restriction endonuclease subunit S [Candidatus Omnitrophota bacterium]
MGKNRRNWEKCELGDIANINERSIGKNYPYDEIEYIDISSVGTGILNETKRYKLAEAPSRAKRLVRSGDTILSTVRPNLRAFSYIKNPKENYVVSTGFAVLTAKHGVDSRFLYYIVTSQEFTDYLTANVKGAAYPAVDTEIISKAKCNLPPLPIQRKIAAILSAYDDLIENNNRRIKILEEMAKTIYNEWFVKFRFPGYEKVKLVPSELGMIPEGWEVVKVGDVIKRMPSGKKYDNKTVLPKGKIPVLDQGRSGIIGYHNNKPDIIASEENPVIIFANHTCYQRIILFPFSAIQNVIPFLPNEDRERDIYWLHWATKDVIKFSDYKGHFPEFTTKKIICPPVDICNAFGGLIKPMVKLRYKLEQKNKVLQETRDLLLPKLISGQIDVEHLEIKVEDNQ